MRLTERLGVDPATASQTYYACLLSHSGCTTDAHVTPELCGDRSRLISTLPCMAQDAKC